MTPPHTRTPTPCSRVATEPSLAGPLASGSRRRLCYYSPWEADEVAGRRPWKQLLVEAHPAALCTHPPGVCSGGAHLHLVSLPVLVQAVHHGGALTLLPAGGAVGPQGHVSPGDAAVPQVQRAAQEGVRVKGLLVMAVRPGAPLPQDGQVSSSENAQTLHQARLNAATFFRCTWDGHVRDSCEIQGTVLVRAICDALGLLDITARSPCMRRPLTGASPSQRDLDGWKLSHSWNAGGRNGRMLNENFETGDSLTQAGSLLLKIASKAGCEAPPWVQWRGCASSPRACGRTVQGRFAHCGDRCGLPTHPAANSFGQGHHQVVEVPKQFHGRHDRSGSSTAGPRLLSGGGTSAQQHVPGRQRLAIVINTRVSECAATHGSLRST